MLLFMKRAGTAAVLFVFLFFTLYFGICVVGGAISGARAGMESRDSQNGYQVGQQAGAKFVRDNLRAIIWGSFGGAAVGSLALSFSGLFPWCRKPKSLS